MFISFPVIADEWVALSSLAVCSRNTAFCKKYGPYQKALNIDNNEVLESRPPTASLFRCFCGRAHLQHAADRICTRTYPFVGGYKHLNAVYSPDKSPLPQERHLPIS